MGLTFKEDCPDIRNSKVFDITDELNGYGCLVDVYDPWIDKEEIDQTDFTLIGNPLDAQKQYDAIVVAVGHGEFKKFEHSDYEKISTDNPVLIDVKGIVGKPTWRL